MQWWCSATGLPWTWSWQWYPGVHLLLIVIGISWWRLGNAQRWQHYPWRPFLLGWITLLITLDWPIGKLGAGYLASVHTGEFLLLTLAAAPAFLRSIPRDGWHALAPAGSHRRRVLCAMTRPLPALLVYNALVISSHFPAVIDGAMTTQLGSFAIDLAWLTAGACLWWPILAPGEFISMGVMGKVFYLFGATVGPTIPAMLMVFSDWPIYRLYELAPRVFVHFTANEDLKLAGLTMKVLGDIPIWIAAITVFFRGVAAKGELINA